MDKTQIADQIMSIVNQMAEKLGVAVEKVYPVLIKQAYVEGFSNIFWIIIVSSIVGVMLYSLWKYLLKEYRNDGDESWICGGMFISSLILFVGFLFFPSIKNTITAFVNPDWYVFNTLLKNLIQ